MDIEKNKQEFIEIYKKNITREGSGELLDYLVKSDFFTAPASTKFHSNVEGGLCFHSVKVYNRFLSLLDNEYGNKRKDVLSDESVAIIALLHDLCKIDCYKVDYKNVKVDGEWTKQPYFAYDELLPYGHGEKSVYIASGFMKLSREEAMAINWHMGGFDSRTLGGSYAMSTAYQQYPTAVLFHIADVMATYLDEEVKK